VGGGPWQDVATAGGAIAGAAIGANRAGAARLSAATLQRCEKVAQRRAAGSLGRIYSFRGREHRVQMASPPGPTISVNGAGETRA